jgi:protein TonB
VPDDLPVMLNREAPFHYPPGLYSRHVQGNVTLRIRIDTTGVVVPESTTVVETSGYAALDSAAVAGTHALRFKPARLHGAPVAVSILLPVYFRHPGLPPLPGDTILHHPSDSGRTP